MAASCLGRNVRNARVPFEVGNALVFTLSFTGEEWWANNGTGTSLNFGYQIGVPALPASTSAGSAVTQLGFTGPTAGTGVFVDAYT